MNETKEAMKEALLYVLEAYKQKKEKEGLIPTIQLLIDELKDGQQIHNLS